MYFAGVDIGSTMTKVVILDEVVLASVIGPTGAEHRRLANKVMEEALERANISFDELSYIVATGYGRINVPFADKQITEITCHAKGVATLFPTVRIAIDIGGQDAKGIKISNGKVIDFVMNDKCAAGTGRFLEVIADTLGLKLEEMGELSLKSKTKVKISSTCTVFAEQEVVSRIAEGVQIEDILAGLHDAIASRVYRMAEKLKIEPDVVLTGGVAKNVGVVKAMEQYVGFPILVPEEPLLTGAIGAAILGKELTLKALESGKPIERGARRLEEATFFK
ncbi:MAG: 2-hydroxyglutaryl-CoA dehydratase [Chloroflexi bacterium]|nr:MAG: 2-hydroxyglutaryl-CoA dehydratase [Chloroflexota bacterium]